MPQLDRYGKISSNRVVWIGTKQPCFALPVFVFSLPFVHIQLFRNFSIVPVHFIVPVQDVLPLSLCWFVFLVLFP